MMRKPTAVLLSFIITTAITGTCLCELPDPWENADLGAPLPGSASETSGVFTIIADGSDIWDGGDNGHYVYQYLEGDGEIQARCLGFTGGTSTNGWRKAGVMIREDLTNSMSRHTFMAITPDNGMAWQGREFTNEVGGSCFNESGAGYSWPAWVRITRVGNTFAGYYSQDGATWTQQGTARTIAMATSAYIGLAVSSHDGANMTEVKFDHITVTGTGNRAPRVDAGQNRVLILPNNDTLTLDGTVTDDGLGNPDGYLFWHWSYISGPGTVAFAPDAFAEDPQVTFSHDPGSYVFELFGSDGDKFNTDRVTVILNEAILGDLNADNRVDLADLDILWGEWLDSPGERADLTGDTVVNLADYSQLAGNWLFRGPSLVINEVLAGNSSIEPPDPQ
ncbi:MAG: DUF1349 domain-containing protein, partial [Sedimentisphaerales bacterium]|nr:DUF1349 domain-containing protein [Sedimentisphaerales bacterium]